jgi:F0F1-type ATP synthase assembly protein I
MPDDPDTKRSFLKDYVKAESMVQLAIAIPAGCLIGWAIGSWLDRHFHQGWIAITGIVLGAVGGFVQMALTAARYLKDNK